MATPSPLSIRLTNGIDTKDDELVQPEMLVLENAVFDRPGSYRKRNGYAAYPAPFASQLWTYQDELLFASSQSVFSRYINPTLGVSPSRGTPTFVDTEERLVYAGNAGLFESYLWSDIAVSNGVALYVWGGTIASHVSLVDLTTGAEYISAATIPSSVYGSHGVATVLANGNIRLYFNGAPISGSGGGTSAAYFDFNTTTPPTSLPSPVTAAATAGAISLDAVSDANASTTVFSSSATPTTVQARNDGGLPVASGATSFTNAAWTVSNTPNSQAIAIDPATGNRWVAVSVGAGTNESVYVYAFTSATTPVQVLAPTLVETLSGTTLISGLAITVNAGRVHIFYSYQGVLNGVSFTETRYRALTTAGSFVAAAQTFAYNYQLASKAFAYSGGAAAFFTYTAAVAAGANTVNTIVMASIDTSFSVSPIARALYETAAPVSGSRVPLGSVTSIGFQSIQQAFLALAQTSSEMSGSSAPSLVTLQNKDRIQTAKLGRSLVISGGLPFEYDATQVVEQNFNYGPVVTTASTPTTGGSLSNGTYTVYAVYAWVNSRGEVEYSKPSDPVNVVLAGGTATQVININVRSYCLTRKSGVQVFVYVAPAGGNNAYFQYRYSTLQTVPFFQSSITSVATNTATLYSQTALRNDPLPHSNFLVRAGDRLWGHPGDGVLWYSKKRIPGRGVEFSALNTKRLTSFNDPVGMAELAGKRYLVFSPTQVAAFTDEGLDGNGNPLFTDDEAIERITGCSDPTSIINIPGGVLFKSLRGWWFIADSLEDTYIGASVEAYNNYPVAGAIVLNDENRVKIVLNGVSAPILVYDILTQKWSVEANSASTVWASAVNWRNNTQLLDISGQLLWEQQPDLFADNGAPVIMRGRTGWIAPAGAQAYIRLKQILLYGQKKSDHNLIVRLRYDYKEAIAETYTFPAGPSVPATDDYQWRIKDPKIQKCRAISIEFLDDFTGYTPGEGYTLNAIDLVVEPKTGAAKIAATRSVAGV